jgi:hypothetical protein
MSSLFGVQILSLERAGVGSLIGVTCRSNFGPVDTLGQWPFGKRGDHKEDTIYINDLGAGWGCLVPCNRREIRVEFVFASITVEPGVQ